MIQFLALSLLFTLIEAKGWGGGSSHSYHSAYSGRSGGNYHVYQTTYHDGGGDLRRIPIDLASGIYFLIGLVVAALIVALCICLIQRCRRRSDGTWYLVDDSSSSSSSSSSDESDCESGSRRVVVRQRPKYAAISNGGPREQHGVHVRYAQPSAVPVAFAVNAGATPSAPPAAAVAVKSSV